MKFLPISLVIGFVLFSTEFIYSQECNIIGDNEVCRLDQEEYTVNHSLSGTGITYQWYITGGGSFLTLPPTNQVVVVEWNQSGTLISEVYQNGVLMQACMFSVTVSNVDMNFLNNTGTPLYQAGGVQTYCLGGMTEIHARNFEGIGGSGGEFNIEWTTEGVEVITSIEVTPDETILHVNFIEEGSVTICAIFSDEIGCQKIICLDFNVISFGTMSFEPYPNVFGSNSLNVCKGQEVYFVNTSEMVGLIDFEWEISDGNNLWFFRSTDLNFTFTEAVEYSVTLKPLVGSMHCDFEPSTILINVADESIVPILCPMPVCTGDEICYTAGVNCTNYDWDVSLEGSIQSTDNDEVCIIWENQPGNSFGAIILNSINCTGNVCAEPTVDYISLFPPGAEITGPDILCEAPTGANYSLPNWEGVMYHWSLDILETTSGTASISPIFENRNPTRITLINFAGRLQLNVIATQNMGGCEFIASKEIVVYNQKISSGTFCFGTDVTISLTPSTSDPVDWIISNQNGSVVYEEMMGGTSVEIPSSSLTSPGIYTTKAMIPGGNPGNCIIENSFTVLAPISNPQISGPINVCLNESHIYSVPNIFGYSVNWQIEEGGQVINPGTTQHMLQHSWTHSTGPYFIRARYVRNNPSCNSEFTELEIHITEPDDIIIMGNENPCPDNVIPEIYMASFQGGSNFHWTIIPAHLGSIVNGQGTGEVGIRWHFVEIPTDVTINVSTLGCNNTPLTNDFIVTLTPINIDINGPDEICAYVPANFSTTAVGDYTWLNGNEVIGHNQSVTLPFTESGLQEITLIVSNPANCNGTFISTHLIEVFPNPIPPIFLNGLLPCPEPAQFPPNISLVTFDYNDPSVVYVWRDNNNNQIGGNSPILSISSTGVYSVQVTNNGCTNRNFYTVTYDCEGTCACVPDVEVNILNWENLSPDCGEFEITGEINPFDDAHIISKFWRRPNPGGGSPIITPIVIGDNQTQRFTYPRAGFYLIELVAEWLCDGGGVCPKDDKVIVKIPVVADFNWTFDCIGDGSTYSVTLNDISSAVDPLLQNEWSGDITTQSGNNISFAGNAGQTYEICLEEETINNYSCRICLMVTVPEKPEPEFVTNLQGFCEAQEVIITTSNIDLSEITQIEWDFGDGSFSHILNPTKVYSSTAGNPYTIKLNLETIHGCSVEYEQDINVNENLLIGTLACSTSLCQTHATLSFSQSAGGNIVYWKWTNGVEGEDVSTIVVDESGYYGLTVWDDLGCSFTTALYFVHLFPAFPPGCVEGITEVCQNLSLSVPNPDGFDFVWSVFHNNILIDTEIGEIYINDALAAGVYQIEIEAFSGTTPCSECEFEVIIHGNPEEPILDDELVNCVPFQATISSNVEVTWFGPGISSNFPIVSDVLSVTQPGVYTAHIANDFGCTSSKEIEIEGGIDFAALGTGCGMVCKEDYEPGDICLEGIPDIEFEIWEWRLNGVAISGESGINSEIECLDIIEAYFDQVITLYVVKDGCLAESEDFFIQGKTCTPCPEDLFLRWMTEVESIHCLDIGTSGEKVLGMSFVLFLPEDYTYCDEDPIFEDGYFDYDIFTYNSTTHSITIEGQYHITDIPGFDEDFIIRGSIELCSSLDPSIKCPAVFEIASMDCHQQCAIDPCENGVVCVDNLEVNQIHGSETSLTYCVYLLEPGGECTYEDYEIFLYDEFHWSLLHDVIPGNIRPNGWYCFEFFYETELEEICLEFEISDCIDTYCESNWCVENEAFAGGAPISIRTIPESLPSFTLVPNPVSGQNPVLHCSDKSLESVIVTIYSTTGEVVKSYSRMGINDGKTTIPIENLNSGYYLININNDADKKLSAYLPLIILNN